jgi:hypothetical protein
MRVGWKVSLNDLISIWCKRAQQTSRSQVFSPVEDAFDEIAATLLNLKQQLCRVFLFSLDISGQPKEWLRLVKSFDGSL